MLRKDAPAVGSNRTWRTIGSIAVVGMLAATTACSGTDASAGEDEKLVIGTVMPALDNEFWQAYADFMEKTADDLGVELVTINANNSGDKLAAGVDNLLAKGVDGIVIVPFFGTGPRSLAAADTEGVPIIAVDALPEDILPGEFENYVGFVGPDDPSAGYAMAEALAATIEPDSDGKKKIVAIQGPQGTSVAINRFAGLEKYLSENDDLELLGSAVGNFSSVDSQNAMDDLLQRHPDAKGVWSVAGGPTTGVLSSLEMAGIEAGKDFQVATMDLSPDVLDAIESGKVAFDTGGHWLEGGFGLIMLYDWINGVRFDDNERTQSITTLPVTRTTVEQFRSDYGNGLPGYITAEHSRHLTPSGPPAVIELQYSTDVDFGLGISDE